LPMLNGWIDANPKTENLRLSRLDIEAAKPFEGGASSRLEINTP
jgi:hypothetical protein